MSIGKRFVHLVKANLNALVDRSESSGSFRAGGRPLEELSDEELEREILRRKERREAAERAASRSYEQEAMDEVERALREKSGRFRTSGYRTGSYGPPRPPAQDPRLAQLYAQLECPYGADLTTVRKHYRALMLKYHPDMHSARPDKQRLATDLSQRLTQAYNELRRLLAR